MSKQTPLEVPSDITDPLIRAFIIDLIRVIEDLETRVQALEAP